MRTKLFALVLASMSVFAVGVATAGARGAHTEKVACHIDLFIQHYPTASRPGQDFGLVKCSKPFGRGVQYDTFRLMPKTPTTGTAVLRFKAYFDTGTVSGVWRATYRYTSATMGIFQQHVTWSRGTGAFEHVRASGTSHGVQSGTHGKIDQVLMVTES
jgi:hypothetical protein